MYIFLKMKFVTNLALMLFCFTLHAQSIEIHDLQTGEKTIININDPIYQSKVRDQMRRALNKSKTEDLGGKDGGGGEPIEIIKKIKKKNNKSVRYDNAFLTQALAVYVDEGYGKFKQRLATQFDGLNFDKIKNTASKEIYLQMKSRNAVKNILNSKIEIRNNCFIEKDGVFTFKTATALMGRPNTDICLDLVRMSNFINGYAQSSVVFGLIMHEYAHHYGYEDTNHQFATDMYEAFAQSYQSDKDFLSDILIARKAIWNDDESFRSDWVRCVKSKTCFLD